jgi:predicted MFS family arabinose efflux permease
MIRRKMGHTSSRLFTALRIIAKDILGILVLGAAGWWFGTALGTLIGDLFVWRLPFLLLIVVGLTIIAVWFVNWDKKPAWLDVDIFRRWTSPPFVFYLWLSTIIGLLIALMTQ